MNTKKNTIDTPIETTSENRISEGLVQSMMGLLARRIGFVLSAKTDPIVVSKYKNLIPATVLAVSLTVTYYVDKDADKSFQENLRTQLTARLDGAISGVQSGVMRLGTIGNGISGFFSASDQVTQKEFEKYIDLLSLGSNSPEIPEIAVIFPKEESQNQTQAGGPKIYPYYIKSLSERRINLTQYEYSQDQVNWEDMQMAQKLKGSVISPELPPVRAMSASQSKFVIFHPLSGKTPYHDPGKENSNGWSVISFDLWALISHISPGLFSDSDLKIYSDITREDLIFDSAAGGENDSKTGLEISKTVKIANKEWLFVIRATRYIENDINNQGYRDIIRYTCILGSFALAVLFYSIVLRRKESIDIINKINKMLTHDALTGIMNRVGFYSCLEHMIAHADRNESSIALLYLDLDMFKDANDTFGHAIGDKLLCAVAQRIRSCVRDEDLVCRMGGDEFTIALGDLRELSDASLVANDIRETLEEVYSIDGHEIHIGASIGIAVYPQDTSDINKLFKYADLAMYRAKASGRNAVEAFSYEIQKSSYEEKQSSERERAIKEALHFALENGGFLMNYQPVVDVKTGKIISMEALVRCYNLKLGFISPGEFIPIAEKSKKEALIIKIGEKIIRMVCEQVAKWKEMGIIVPKIAINLSALQIQTPGLIEFIQETLTETGVSAKELSLEITESMTFKDEEIAISTISSLSEMGFTIAIDDFGTGYSNFGRFMQFCISTLKIDRSFVLNMNTVDGTKTMRAAIVAAKEMGMGTIAEGVETKEEFEKLREMGCDSIQGYFFSKPENSEDMTRSLASDRIFDVGSTKNPYNFEI